ncbi:MAG: DUF58 domain-containing protein [Acidobacteriota bacterium]
MLPRRLLAAFRLLTRRRVRYRVTRGGALFVLALLLTGAGAFLSANNLLFLVFSSMLALLLVSGFLSRLVLAGLELELALPEHVSARTPVAARVSIRNLKLLIPSFSIELTGDEDPLNDTPSILSTPVYFPLLPGRGAVEASVQVTFPRRGRHHDNLFILATKFPFGFLRKSARVTLHRETIVYPALEPGPETELLLEEVAGEIEGQVRGAGLDFYRIRPYESTDSARLVDWKSTAHTGDLQVREFSKEERRAVEIYFDRRAPRQHHAWFERAVEQCAWLLWQLADREIDVTLRSQNGSFVVLEEADVYEPLRFLALVEPALGAVSETRAAEPPLDPSSVHVVFSLMPEAFENAGWRAPSRNRALPPGG